MRLALTAAALAAPAVFEAVTLDMEPGPLSVLQNDPRDGATGTPYTAATP